MNYFAACGDIQCNTDACWRLGTRLNPFAMYLYLFFKKKKKKIKMYAQKHNKKINPLICMVKAAVF